MYTNDSPLEIEDEDGYGYGSVENEEITIDYFKLDQHPKAKDVYSRFDPQKKYAACTIAEHKHFDDIYPAIEYYLFFDQAPSTYNHFYTFLNHNIRIYILYSLAKTKELEIHAFDSSAALSALKTSATTEVIAPSIGSFVISFEHDARTIDIILQIGRHPHSMEWNVYTKDTIDHSIFDKLIRDSVKKHNLYKGKTFTRTGEFINLVNVSFDDITLDEKLREDVKENIIEYIDEDYVKLKKKNNLPTKRGVIFAGAPGTGKTFLSRVLANHLKTSFMIVTDLSHVNDVRDIFSFAKKFDRIVILFEDIDIYIKSRDLGSDLLPVLLNSLDGIEINHGIVVLCTTNNVDAMDKAMKDRPGRFDRILHFEAPSIGLKEVMLKKFCKDKNIDGVDFKEVVKNIPDKYTGAHLKEIYIIACNKAIKNNSIDDKENIILSTTLFNSAITSIKNRKEPERIGFSA